MGIACRKVKFFVPDQLDPRLPEYSESGRNIGGAIINDTAWRTKPINYIKPLGIYSSISGDSTVFSFNGSYIEGTRQRISLSLFVVIKGLKIEKEDSLMKLKNKTFLLDGINSYSAMGFFDIDSLIGNGKLVINTVKKISNVVYGDGSPSNPRRYPYNISGTFEFTIKGSKEYKIQNGRFDMVVRDGYELRMTQ